MNSSPDTREVLCCPTALLPIGLSLGSILIVFMHLAFYGAASSQGGDPAAHVWQILMLANPRRWRYLPADGSASPGARPCTSSHCMGRRSFCPSQLRPCPRFTLSTYEFREPKPASHTSSESRATPARSESMSRTPRGAHHSAGVLYAAKGELFTRPRAPRQVHTGGCRARWDRALPTAEAQASRAFSPGARPPIAACLRSNSSASAAHPNPAESATSPQVRFNLFVAHVAAVPGMRQTSPGVSRLWKSRKKARKPSPRCAEIEPNQRILALRKRMRRSNQDHRVQQFRPPRRQFPA